jgi:hypothetical protein
MIYTMLTGHESGLQRGVEDSDEQFSGETIFC